MDIYVAGSFAAFAVDLLIYPLDTLKTRYQSQDFMKTYAPGSNRRPLELRGLYQGLGSVILASLPAAGVFFSTYENTKNLFSRILPVPQPFIHSSASAVAEMASCLVLVPAEVIKQNAQMIRNSGGVGHRSTSLQAVRHIGGKGAAGRLFTGYTALVARNLPFTAMQFPLFEHIRSRLWESRIRDCQRSEGILETGLIAAVSAGTAGAIAAFITTPGDVVKTRMMLVVGKEGEGAAESKKRSVAISRDIYAERGVRGFFRGGMFRSAWTAIGSSLYLGTYDAAKLWLKRRKSGTDDDIRL